MTIDQPIYHFLGEDNSPKKIQIRETKRSDCFFINSLIPLSKKYHDPVQPTFQTTKCMDESSYNPKKSLQKA